MRLRFGVTAGLEPAVSLELVRRGCEPTASSRGAVTLDTDPETAARLLLGIRASSRIVWELAAELPATRDPLHGELCRLAWEEWLPDGKTIAVRASGRSEGLRHTGFAAQVVKDAIHDRFRALGRAVPPVDPEKARLVVDLRIEKRGCSVGIDLAGGSLHRRESGRGGAAPLREDVAAGLALLADPDPEQPLLDPCCGSGTFIAEAFAAAHRLPAGRRAAATAMPLLPPFRELPLAEIEAAERPVFPEETPPVIAADRNPRAVEGARRALERQGLGEIVRVRRSALEDFRLPDAGPGLLISNPPWGLRLTEEVEATWRHLGTLARRLPGWHLAFLSGDPSLSRHLGLKAERRHPVRISGVDTRLLTYRMRS